MKRIKYLILVLVLMIIPILSINAEEIKEVETDAVEEFHIVTGDSITSSKDVMGSSVVAGENVTVENTVKGISMAFGNNVNYNANSDYTLLAGNVVNVKGITTNDGLILGNAVTFDKEYIAERDLFIFASTVTLKGEIARDVKIYASSVVLEDVKINGNITIKADNIDIKNADISSLSYNEESIINISSNAVINEKSTFISHIDKNIKDVILENIIDYASILVTFVALVLILPLIFRKIENKFESISISKFISMLGYGLFSLIIIPIIFILLIALPITLPLSLLILITYIIAISLSTILTGYFLGLIIWNKFIKKDKNTLLIGLIGISIIKVLSLIPVVGTITIILSLLISLSIFIKLFTKDA